MSYTDGGSSITVSTYLRGRDTRADKAFHVYLERTGQQPEYIIQAPGRVNIIGDHIDYHGFPVMPMAVEGSIFLAGGRQLSNAVNAGERNHNMVKLYNERPYEFPDWIGEAGWPTNERLTSIAKEAKWQNYFLCGYYGVLMDTSQVDRLELGTPNKSLMMADDGICIALNSDLPPASGLSSSSALVCAAAVATQIHIHGLHSTSSKTGEGIRENNNLILDRNHLAARCSNYERLIGIQGGGMDQAVIMTADKGYAKFVEFVPRLRCQNIKLPRGLAYLISHCGHQYPKAATSSYNARVLETKLAACLIAKQAVGLEEFPMDKRISLLLVKEKLGMSFEQYSHHIKHHWLTKEVYSTDEICRLLGFSSGNEDLIANFGTTQATIEVELGNQFKLRSRCLHVVEEAWRVTKFRHLCQQLQEADTPREEQEPMFKELGTLMTDSHYSLRDLYQCSHPSLDRIVEKALEAGALGSRLTGAGWGGCTITMVEESKCNFVMSQLKAVSKIIIRTEPQAGCKILKVGNH